MSNTNIKFSDEDIEALKKAIAKGVQTVSYGDRSVTYRNLDEMMRTLQIVTASRGKRTQKNLSQFSYRDASSLNYVTKHKPSLTKRLKGAVNVLFKRYYEGPSFSKDNRSWNLITRTSANVENRVAGQIMANRARSLLRDSPYAHGALQTIVHNTVGAGIVPQIRCDDEGTAKDLSEFWHEWAGSTAIDIEGRQDFYSLQAQVLRTIVSDGESLVRVVNSKNSSRIPYQLQVLEPDYLDTYKEYRTETGYISSGIEFKKVSDTRFDRSAYWLFKEHPGGFLNLQSYQSFSGVSIPVPADEILHVYRVDRPGAIRGVSWFHPCILALSDLHDYQQAVLTARFVNLEYHNLDNMMHEHASNVIA